MFVMLYLYVLHGNKTYSLSMLTKYSLTWTGTTASFMEKYYNHGEQYFKKCLII